VQERLVELAKHPELQHDTIYFGLSTLQSKSRPVVEYFLSVLEDSDWENTSRTLWGLTSGVATSEQSLVAEKVLKLFEARNEVRMQSYSVELLAKYCDATHVPALRKLSDNPLLEDPLRAELQKTIAMIEAR